MRRQRSSTVKPHRESVPLVSKPSCNTGRLPFPTAIPVGQVDLCQTMQMQISSGIPPLRYLSFPSMPRSNSLAALHPGLLHLATLLLATCYVLALATCHLPPTTYLLLATSLELQVMLCHNPWLPRTQTGLAYTIFTLPSSWVLCLSTLQAWFSSPSPHHLTGRFNGGARLCPEGGISLTPSPLSSPAAAPIAREVQLGVKSYCPTWLSPPQPIIDNLGRAHALLVMPSSPVLSTACRI